MSFFHQKSSKMAIRDLGVWGSSRFGTKFRKFSPKIFGISSESTFFPPLSSYSFSGGMRDAQPTTGVTPKLLGLLCMPNAPELVNSTCSRLRKPNLDAPGPTLLKLQDRTVRQCTERTMFPTICFQKITTFIVLMGIKNS
jgi:hypothetical protein